MTIKFLPSYRLWVGLACILLLIGCSNEITAGFGSVEQEVNERELQVTVPVHLGRSSRTGVAVPYVPIQSNSITVRIPYTVSGTAEYPTNHGLQAGTITIPPGEIATDIIFPVVPGTFEPSKTVVITLGDPDFGSLESASVHTVTIVQQPSTPMDFVSSSMSVSESVGSLSIPVNLGYEAYHDVTVDYTISGNATNPTDHDAVSGTLTFPAGVTQMPIDFSIVDDSIYEGGETLHITLSNPSNYARLGDTSVLSITINDDDPAPTVNFATSSQTVSEPNGLITVPITLSVPSDVNTNITYTIGGTADQTDDHDLTQTLLTVSPGLTTDDIEINIVDDGLTESNETIVITITSVGNGYSGSTLVHTVTIIDDESAPIVDFDMPSRTVTEGVGSLNLTAELTHGTAFDVDVPYTVTGTSSRPQDHNLASGTITITAGQTTNSQSFNVVNDTMDENDETIIVTMGVPTNAGPGLVDEQTTTITDNDSPPVADFTTSTQTVAESVGTVTVNMTLTAASSFDVTVPYTISGSSTNPADHDLAGGTFTILAGATTASTTFTVVDDALYEATETVIVTMGSPTNASAGVAVQTVSITNNDAAPIADFSAATQSVSEGVGSVTITANLNVASGLTTIVPFTVSGTAANPADHNLGDGTVTIAAGATSGTTSFTVVSDTRDEADETVILTMGNPTNGTKGSTFIVQTITITDDDPRPTVSFSASSQSVAETAGTVFIIVVLSAASSFDVSMPFTLSGTAVNPTNHDFVAGSISITSGNVLGNATFNVINDGVATGNLTVIVTQGVPTNADPGATTVHTVTILDAGREFDHRGLERWFSADRGTERTPNDFVEKWTPIQAADGWTDPLRWNSAKRRPQWQIPLGSVWPEVKFTQAWPEEFKIWSGRKVDTKRVYWVEQTPSGLSAQWQDYTFADARKLKNLKAAPIVEWMVFDVDTRAGSFSDVDAYLRGRYGVDAIERKDG